MLSLMSEPCVSIERMGYTWLSACPGGVPVATIW
jgi:hypothetical protein